MYKYPLANITQQHRDKRTVNLGHGIATSREWLEIPSPSSMENGTLSLRLRE